MNVEKTPINTHNQLVQSEEEKQFDIPLYQATLRSLMWATVATRLNITFAVHTLLQFT
jgi:hypothetical protein